MAQKTLSFCPISATAFQLIRQSLASQGVNLPDVHVSTSPVDAGHGYSVSWEWACPAEPDQPWLSVTIDGGGFLMGMAESKIKDLISPFVGK